jgi:thiamine biosynthesis lipoprotein
MDLLDFRAMGSPMRAAVETAAPNGQAGLAAVPGWFAEWEAQLSRFRPDSELSLLNAAAGRPVTVGPVLWAVVQAALAAAEWTNGLVTPTVLAAVERAGYDRSFEALPVDAGSTEPAPLGRGLRRAATDLRNRWRAAGVAGTPNWRAIRTDEASHCVTLPPGIRLDAGGIAKGWAADEAVRRLAEYGPALVDAGGDIAVSGPRTGGERWPVAVACPFAPDRHLARMWLAGGGVATSGRDVHRWRRDGQWRHHIIDPRTGQPAVTDVQTATVVADSARGAEAAAKTALILGRRRGLAWIEAHPPLAALLVTDDGEVHASRRLAKYLGG